MRQLLRLPLLNNLHEKAGHTQAKVNVRDVLHTARPWLLGILLNIESRGKDHPPYKLVLLRNILSLHRGANLKRAIMSIEQQRAEKKKLKIQEQKERKKE
eukprot:TRINITY_DN2864_c1_g6_i2.p1 TRINITY_DN2864_c1_g6~~TRINITY_DN2864_c1_g6_i2.p1  ORF type:complete len:100 (-),score=10.82 TRINITY_DN2864_c1_g6_i2:123-422(-)